MKSAFLSLSTTAKFSGLAAILFFIGYVQAAETGERKIKVDDSTFKCILKMTAVRGFFVGNLAGNLAGAVAVAEAGKGEYPEGTVLQLIPNEAMIKQQKGFSPGTNDWEFFALNSDKNGSKIVSREPGKSTTSWGSIALNATKRRGRNSISCARRIMAASRCRSRARCSTRYSTPIRVASRRNRLARRTPPR